MADFKFASYDNKTKHAFPCCHDCAKFVPALEALLGIVPKGTPNFHVLQAVLYELHKKYKIFGEKKNPLQAWQVAGDHADSCKAICTIGLVCHMFSSLLSCHEQTHSNNKSTLASLAACLPDCLRKVLSTPGRTAALCAQLLSIPTACRGFAWTDGARAVGRTISAIVICVRRDFLLQQSYSEQTYLLIESFLHWHMARMNHSQLK